MGRTIEQKLDGLFGMQRFAGNPALDATIRETLQRCPDLRPDARTREAEAKTMTGGDGWEREALFAKELAKYGGDRQVIDCFARHMVAHSVAEADPEQRPPFSRKTLEKNVEELKNGERFRRMVKTHGVQAMREALAAKDAQTASVALYAPRSERRNPEKEPPEQRQPAAQSGAKLL